ncbi:MAG: acetylornithine/succinylornithine family transaminase [Eubacteriales bacterium]|nr:acetylornithine/succinylornithine family transaminase [Eubacteriales bacterium]
MKLKDYGLTPEQVIEKTKKYLIEPGKRLDFVCERAEGMYMYDSAGQAYLDFFAGIAVNSAGSCNPAVVKAIQDQAADVMHASAYIYTLPLALLSERVCTSTGMDKVFFQNSGAEANEAMIKMARKYGIDHYGANDWKIVTARGSFHGRTLGAMAATGQPDNACQMGFGPMVPGFSYAEYNNLESFREAVDDDTIAIMLEPVEGESGVYPATPEFMKGIRELCDEKGILLLLDEVQTGWGRTGSLMAYMGYGIKPDIISMAKALGGGVPIGAVAAKEAVAKAFTPGSHGSTFGGNALVCAAALAETDEIISKNLPANAAKVGPYLMEKLRGLPHVKEVRGRGLMVGVEFDDAVEAGALKEQLFKNHLLVTAIGNRILRLVPPLICTEADCDKAAEILNKSVLELTE